MEEQKKKGKTGRIVLIILGILLAAFVALGLLIFSELERFMDPEKLENVEVNEEVAVSSTGSDYMNFVVYGVDSRSGGLTTDCHSDTIIIASLHKPSGEIRLVSVYRDTYLDNTNGEYRKATECYFYGGPERSMSMLNRNLDLALEDYVTFNFNGVVKVIDLLGGIDLEITEEEMGYINGYCVENEQVTGASYVPLTQAGLVHLTGTQALAYCRIRYTEGWDFKRTERQRTVLQLAWMKAREAGFTKTLSMIRAMLPEVSTSLSLAQIIELAGGMNGYTFGETAGFPFEQTAMDLPDAGDVVVPVNLAQNVSELHAFLFGEEGYVPSSAVQEISNRISEVSGVY